MIVDDDELDSQMLQRILRDHGVAATTHLNNESAIASLDNRCRFGGQLDLVFTDLMRLPSCGIPSEGIKLIRHIRNRPSNDLLFGGFRLRKVPIAVVSGRGPSLHAEVRQIDTDIQVFDKAFDLFKVPELMKSIGTILRRHRRAVLRDFQEAGVAFFWEDGRYRVARAFRAPAGGTEYWRGTAELAGRLYTRLVLVAEAEPFGSVALRMLEQILNDPLSRERDFQEFFSSHPELLSRDHDVHWAEPVLSSPSTGDTIRPDFVLQPRGMREAAWRWLVVDLKQPTAPLLSGSRFHPTLSSYVQKVATQLRDYGRFFEDPRNGSMLRKKFGGIVPRPKLIAIIGRLPTQELERYAELRARLGNVTITTYDEILQTHRATMDWMKTLYL